MKKFHVLFIAFLLALPSHAFAYWVWSPESGKFVNPEGGAAADAAEEQYDFAMRFHREKNLDDAVQHLEDLLKDYPTSRIAPEAQYRLGTIYEEKNDYLKAYDAYKRLVRTYPQSERFAEVIEREFRIGNLFLSGQKARFMGFEVLPALSKAAEVFNHIVENAPYSAYGDKAQFHKGLAFQKMGRFKEASEAFQDVIDQYPQSELVPKARFQLAQTSYDRSASQFRDQRALDDASRNIDRFIERYPDAQATEKAMKLRQVVDEKNAEKNYRVGAYYEKQNFLSSALIYYEDVSVRYPHTKWGAKAKKRLSALAKPAEYLSAREKEFVDQKKDIEAKLTLLDKKDKETRPKLEAEWKRLDEQENALSKEKKDSLKRRHEDLKRRERELDERFKKLEKKRKLAKDNPSEDFKRAMDRWHSALVTEKEALIQERKQLDQWHESLGVHQAKDFLNAIPFMGEGPTELEKIRQMEAKKLYKLSEEKRTVFEEKEYLYKRLDEVSSMLRASQVEELGFQRNQTQWLENIQVDEAHVAGQQQKLKEIRLDIETLEEQLESQKSEYESRFGQSAFMAILKAPAKILTTSTAAITKSFAFINPFDGTSEQFEGKSEQELLELRMHYKERIAAQQSITETLQGAFDAELALGRQRRLLEQLEKEEDSDPFQLRKTIKALEKKIRGNYQEIDDRDKKKQELLKELSRVVREKEASDGFGERTARAITAPAVVTGKAVKAFLFGFQDEGLEITEEAERINSDASVGSRVAELKGEIELENLMIQAKSEEIKKIEKELEIMKAKASLAGGYKFRSAFVEVPYQFIGDAIEGAKKMIPSKDREEVLIARLDEETQELEALRSNLKAVEMQIEKKTGKTPVNSEPKMVPGEISMQGAAPEIKEQIQMREKIEELVTKIEKNEKVYQEQRELFEKQLGSSKSILKEEKQQRMVEKHKTKEFEGQKKELDKKLEGVRKEIAKLIEKESKLEAEESEVLEKRITEIDRILKKIQSKAMSQDLLTERERMESRLGQIELRRDFLSKELSRFRMNKKALTA